MNNYEFTEQMNRLITQFGKNNYSTERVAVVWREAQKLSAKAFEGIVDEFLGSSRHAPLMPEFREQISIVREREWSKQKLHAQPITIDRPITCGNCRDNGTFLCKHKDGESGLWAFRCNCSKGNSDPRRMIPQFKQEHRELYDWFDVRMYSLLNTVGVT